MTQVTIKHVAKKAGLSIATVSRVINDHPDVSAQTRRRVLQVIDELGYEPNAVARSLIHGRSNVLGVVSTGIEFFGPSQTMAGIEREAYRLGYWLLSSLLPDPETTTGADALRHLLSQQVDGIIWAVPEVGKNRDWICEQSHTLPVPVVFLHMTCRSDVFVVMADNYAGARSATEHLLDQGRTVIGCIRGPDHWWEAQERVRGWRDTLTGAGLPAGDEWCQAGDWSAASGYDALMTLARQNPDLDAVFASNDQMALGALNAAHRLGLTVPDDLAVVGFDDIPEAAYFLPPLTTVRHDLKAVGTQAATLLERLLTARRNREVPRPESVVITPELIVRDSSQPSAHRRDE